MVAGFLASFQERGDTERGDHLNFLYILIHEDKKDETIGRYESISKAGIIKEPLQCINAYTYIYVKFTSVCT